jgi:hypothetical protein
MIQSQLPGGVHLLIYAYLEGSDLFHKIAQISKRTRQQISWSALLNQQKVLIVKAPHKKYAL